MDVKGAESAAVVAGTDSQDSWPASCLHSNPSSVFNCGQVKPVDDDFVDRIDPFRKSGLDEAAQRRTVGIVGAGPELFVFAADFAAATNDPTRKRQNHSRDRLNGGSGCFRCGERCPLTFSQDQEVAARDTFDGSEDIFAGKLAVHDGQPPESSVFQLLAELEAIAEEPQGPTDLDRLVFHYRQAVITGGRCTSKNALSDTIDCCLLKSIPAKSEHQQARSRPAIGRFFGRQDALNPCFGIAADDGGCIARGLLSGNPHPMRCLGGHNEPGRRHGKGFGKCVLDRYGVDRKQGGTFSRRYPTFEDDFTIPSNSFHLQVDIGLLQQFLAVSRVLRPDQDFQQVVKVPFNSFPQHKTVVAGKFTCVIARPQDQVIGLGDNDQFFVSLAFSHVNSLISVQMSIYISFQNSTLRGKL